MNHDLRILSTDKEVLYTKTVNCIDDGILIKFGKYKHDEKAAEYIEIDGELFYLPQKMTLSNKMWGRSMYFQLYMGNFLSIEEYKSQLMAQL